MIDLEAALQKQIVARHPDAALAFSTTADPSSDAVHAASVVAGKAMAAYAERFYTSIGFDPLPATFWERSQFVRPRDRDVVCHASAWFGVQRSEDLRIKMCIHVDADDFTTVHHEEGHTDIPARLRARSPTCSATAPTTASTRRSATRWRWPSRRRT